MSTAEEWISKEGAEKALAKLVTDFYNTQAVKPWDNAEQVTRPTEGKIKPGGWKANTDPDNWSVEAMKDNPALFKVVDKEGKNVATDFSTKQIAEQYIKWFVINENPDEAEPEQPEDGGTGEEPKPVAGQGPYPGKGEMKSTRRGPTVRHYASGKPDDMTVEENLKKIPYDNYMFLCWVTMGEMAHDDNVSLKSGGVHMGGSGWYDNGVSVYKGLCCLGTEPKHPQTNACIIKGKEIGDIRNKRVGICNAYFKKEDKIELWTNLGDGWVKQLEKANLDNLDPNDGGKRKENEAQLRIDGWKKLPKLEAVVQEIVQS